MDSISFGRYVNYDSFIHRLDARNKILLLIALMIMIFMPFSTWSTSLIFSLLYFIILMILMGVSHCSFKSFFKGILSMWFLLLFLIIMFIFIPNPSLSSVPLYTFNESYTIYWDGIYQAGYIFLRLILMMSLTLILTSTTKPLDLTYALEWYMYPLNIINFPSHTIAMMISIALRFIPTILDEAKRIMKAQESRGVDFSRGGLFKKVKAIISLIIPLFVSAFDRSQQLSDAMEARGYDPNSKRSRYRKLKFHLKDLISALIILPIVAFIMYLSIAQNDLDIIYTLFKVEVGF